MQEWKLLGKSEIEVSKLLKKTLKKKKKKKKKKKRKAVNKEVDDVSTGSLRQAVPVKHITQFTCPGCSLEPRPPIVDTFSVGARVSSI